MDCTFWYTRLLKKPVRCVIAMVSCFTYHSTALPEVGDKPHQPTSLPTPQKGLETRVTRRSFQPQWFEMWTWIHYNEGEDLTLCFPCVIVYQNKHLNSVSNMEQTFISTGFSNWKDATSKFSKHESNLCHKEGV